MSKDYIGYDKMVDTALRGVVREALRKISEDGLVGGHHLYITFRTAYPGVEVPDYLVERYPDELTVVMQHQFWGLEVEDDKFSVMLSFNKQRENITVPFAALTRFADPGVKFGLQFEPIGDEGAALRAPFRERRAAELEEEERLAESETEGEANAAGDDAPAAAHDDAEGGSESPEEGASRVVRLDAFRKK